MATREKLIAKYSRKEQAWLVATIDVINDLQELQPTLADEELLRAIMKDLEQYLSANAFWDVRLDCNFDEIKKTISKHILKQPKREIM